MQRITKNIFLVVLALAWVSQQSLRGNNIDSLLQVANSGIANEAAVAYKELARISAPDSLDLTIYYTRRGIELARQSGNQLLIGNLHMNLGVAHDIHDRFEHAIAHYDTARQIFTEIGDADPWLATVDINCGAAYYFAGYRTLALEHWLKAYDKIERNADDADYAALLNNIATMYEELGKYPDAIKYYEESLALKKERADSLYYYNSLMNLGKIYGEIQQPSKALQYLREAEVGFAQVAGTISAVNAQIYQARVLLTADRIEEAAAVIYPLVKDGLIKHRSSRRVEGLMIAGDVSHAQNNYHSAIQYYLQAQDIIEKSGVQFDQDKLREKLSSSLFAANRPIEAYQELRKSLDGITVSTKRDRLALEQEMQVKFNTLQKEQENISLQSQNAIKDLSLQKTKKTLGLALLGIILIGGFAIQIYLNRRKIETLNTHLRQQKDLISKSLAEKEVLLKEIHHRVKNNLQVVSSLLGIQARQVRDKAAVEALKEGRSRVQSMSLIHQNLYSQDNLTGIGLKNYFKKLAENLLLTYSLSTDQIQLTSDIDEIVLDVDTVIPLGLVLNELISNALKYAFPGGSGKIHVKIKELTEGLLLSVRDNGIGMHHPEKIKESDSFGYDLINSFVEKMDGELEIHVDQGTEVKALLRSYQKAA